MITNEEIEKKLAVLRKEYISATVSEKEIIKRRARCLQIIKDKRANIL